MADDFTGKWRYWESNAHADMTNAYLLTAKQEGDVVRGTLKYEYSAAMSDHVYAKGEDAFEAKVVDGTVTFSCKGGDYRLRPVEGGLEVTRLNAGGHSGRADVWEWLT